MMFQEYVIITAGGQGNRMGSEQPKQFLELNGLPVIMHSIRAFAEYSGSIKFILVLPENHMERWHALINKFPLDVNYTTCSGGETRFESVKKGLELIDGEGLVAVHDAVRPIVSVPLIRNCFQVAREHGNAIPVTLLADSVREVLDNESRPADRERFRLVQTPQIFDVPMIKSAYKQAYRASFTDDANVAETYGAKIFLVEGERKNIKITTHDDLIIAEAYLKI